MSASCGLSLLNRTGTQPSRGEKLSDRGSKITHTRFTSWHRPVVVDGASPVQSKSTTSPLGQTCLKLCGSPLSQVKLKSGLRSASTSFRTEPTTVCCVVMKFSKFCTSPPMGTVIDTRRVLVAAKEVVFPSEPDKSSGAWTMQSKSREAMCPHENHHHDTGATSVKQQHAPQGSRCRWRGHLRTPPTRVRSPRPNRQGSAAALPVTTRPRRRAERCRKAARVSAAPPRWNALGSSPR
eukprot:scaffold7033_cov257-Pinguiococcus_pyrenoidosus.AAC.16